MVYFSGGETFKELWADIPTCQSREEYIGLLNYIEDCAGDREITEFDKRFLIECLERFAQLKGWEPA